MSDTLVYGQTRARCVEKKKTATTTLKASSTRDTLETRHISVVRWRIGWRIRNVLVLALYALQIVQVERLSCNLCAISYDRSRFILSPAPQRNATVLFSTSSPRLQTVIGVRLSRYSCLQVLYLKVGLRYVKTLQDWCEAARPIVHDSINIVIQHPTLTCDRQIHSLCRYTLLL